MKNYLLNLISSFSREKSKVDCISVKEKKRLRAFPRYTKTETAIFGVPFYINDACTLLQDIDEIIYNKIYKFETTSLCPLIIDCGANIGISVLFFKKLYPESRVIAFEPDPILYEMLSRNISTFLFEGVEIHNSAVWVDNYGVKFIIEGGHSGRIANCDKAKNIVSVPSVRLKAILDSLDIVDMLKIDIEGAEAEVLFDCQKILKKCQHIFVEYHSKNAKKQELHNILRLLSDIGFRYHIHEAFKRKHPFMDRECMVDMDMQLNIFLYKEKC